MTLRGWSLAAGLLVGMARTFGILSILDDSFHPLRWYARTRQLLLLGLRFHRRGLSDRALRIALRAARCSSPRLPYSTCDEWLEIWVDVHVDG